MTKFILTFHCITCFWNRVKNIFLSIIQAFANPEDTCISTGGKVTFHDPDVERTRRVHLNDIENIYLFFASAGFYLFTNPGVQVAVNCFRIFAGARILHSVIYIYQVDFKLWQIHFKALNISIFYILLFMNIHKNWKFVNRNFVIKRTFFCETCFVYTKLAMT